MPDQVPNNSANGAVLAFIGVPENADTLCHFFASLCKSSFCCVTASNLFAAGLLSFPRFCVMTSVFLCLAFSHLCYKIGYWVCFPCMVTCYR